MEQLFVLYNFNNSTSSTSALGATILAKLKLNDTQKDIIEAYFQHWWSMIERALEPSAIQWHEFNALCMIGLCKGVASEEFIRVSRQFSSNIRDDEILKSLKQIIKYSTPLISDNQVSNCEDIYNYCFSKQLWMNKGETFIQRKTLVANHLRQMLFIKMIELTGKKPNEILNDCSALIRREGIIVDLRDIRTELHEVLVHVPSLEHTFTSLSLSESPTNPSDMPNPNKESLSLKLFGAKSQVDSIKHNKI